MDWKPMKADIIQILICNDLYYILAIINTTQQKDNDFKYEN